VNFCWVGAGGGGGGCAEEGAGVPGGGAQDPVGARLSAQAHSSTQEGGAQVQNLECEAESAFIKDTRTRDFLLLVFFH